MCEGKQCYSIEGTRYKITDTETVEQKLSQLFLNKQYTIDDWQGTALIIISVALRQ
jgi:hypothetical protein